MRIVFPTLAVLYGYLVTDTATYQLYLSASQVTLVATKSLMDGRTKGFRTLLFQVRYLFCWGVRKLLEFGNEKIYLKGNIYDNNSVSM